MNGRLKILAVGDIADASEVHVGDDAMLLGLLRTRAFSELDLVLTVVAGRIDAARDLYCSEAIRRPRLRRGAAHRNERSEQIDRFVKLVIGPSRNLRSSGAWVQLANAVQHADALLIAGGGSLNSTWDDHIALRLAVARGADAIGKPIVVTGQTIGPHFVEQDREAVVEIIELSRWFGVRERASELLARSLTHRGALRLGADDAMFLGATEPEVDDDSDWRGVRTERRGYIAVTFDVGALPENHTADVAREIGDIAAQYRLDVVFVPHLQRFATRSPDDVTRSVQLKAALPRGVSASIANVSVDVAARFARHAAVVVTSRYHPVVFALGSGVPVVSVSQDHYTFTKCAGAAELFGLEQWNVPSAALRSGMLSEAVGEAMARRAEVSDRLLQLGCLWREHSELRAVAMVELFGGGSSTDLAVPEVAAPLRPSGRWAVAASIITAQGIALEGAQAHRADTAAAAQEYIADLVQRAATEAAAALEARSVTEDLNREAARLHLAHADERAARLDLERELAHVRAAAAGELAELRSAHAELHELWLQAELDQQHVQDASAAQRQKDSAIIDRLEDHIRRLEEQTADAGELRSLMTDSEKALHALRQTKTFRFTSRPRTVYGRLRGWRWRAGSRR